jgi:Carboxypeptidase regulatory-like domain
MTLELKRKFGIPKQRGFWLRCFLSAMVCLFWSHTANLLHAQVDIPGPERLAHVQGVVVNDTGHPVADMEVTLARDEQIAHRTQTDQSGKFRFEHVRSGSYVFRVKRSENAPAERQIVVTDEVVTALERKKLYVILGPGACQDACSSVLASKRDFDRAIRKISRH